MYWILKRHCTLSIDSRYNTSIHCQMKIIEAIKGIKGNHQFSSDKHIEIVRFENKNERKTKDRS